MNRTTTWLTSILLFAGCGGGDAEPAGGEGPAGGDTAGGEAPAGADDGIAWADRTFDQKRAYMSKVVLPTMKRIFQEFDPTEFAEVRCSTCHGATFEEVQFHMPNGLHPLDPAHMPTPDSSDSGEARWARFMMEKVKPEMARLLGLPEYDPATQQGFGCFNCHAMAGGAAP